MPALRRALSACAGEARQDYERALLWLEHQLGEGGAGPEASERLDRLWAAAASAWQRKELCALARGTLGLEEPWTARQDALWRAEGAELAPYLAERTQALVEAGRLPAAEELCARLAPALRGRATRFRFVQAKAWAWLGWGRFAAGQRLRAREAFERSLELRATLAGQLGRACELWQRDLPQALATLRAARPRLGGPGEPWARLAAAAERLAAGGSLRRALRACAPRQRDPRPLRAWLTPRWLELVTCAGGAGPLEGRSRQPFERDLTPADWRQVDELLEGRARGALERRELGPERVTRLCWVLVTRSPAPAAWEERGARALAVWQRARAQEAQDFARAHAFSPDVAPPRAGIARRQVKPTIDAAGEFARELEHVGRAFRRQRFGEALARARALEDRLEGRPLRLCQGWRRDAELLLGRRALAAEREAWLGPSSLARLRQLSALGGVGAELLLAHCEALGRDARAPLEQRAEVRYLQVQALVDLGRRPAALALIDEVLPSLEGHDVSLCVLRAQVLQRLGRADEAREQAGELAMRYPSRIGVQLPFANLLITQKRYEAAEQVLAHCRSLERRRPGLSRRIDQTEARLRRAQSEGD